MTFNNSSYICGRNAQCWVRIIKAMAKKNEIIVKDVTIRTININGVDYICISDVARQKNAIDPNGVIGN